MRALTTSPAALGAGLGQVGTLSAGPASLDKQQLAVWVKRKLRQAKSVSEASANCRTQMETKFVQQRVEDGACVVVQVAGAVEKAPTTSWRKVVCFGTGTRGRARGFVRWAGKRLRFHEIKAADLVTSYYMADRPLFWYRLTMLLYITWATGMQMYHFFTATTKKGWSLMSPLDYYMYLTHWCFSFVWLYYLLSTVASGYRLASNLARNVDSDWADPATVVQSIHATLTYSAFIVSLLLSQLVTIAFWAGVLMKFSKGQAHDFGGDHGFFICVNVHGLQSVVILVDFFLLDRIRLQWVHGALVYGLIALYLPVNYFYTVVRQQRVYDDVFCKDVALASCHASCDEAGVPFLGLEMKKTLGSFGGVMLTLTLVYFVFVAISKTRERYNEVAIYVKSTDDVIGDDDDDSQSSAGNELDGLANRLDATRRQLAAIADCNDTVIATLRGMLRTEPDPQTTTRQMSRALSERDQAIDERDQALAERDEALALVARLRKRIDKLRTRF
ncbi:hypothetical protein PBRA_007367 [Plasmodiophora brassicae]|uniref:Uncharacterized protein n=1 Tax=Plasmodiophora brassicae TaxID=37360 RepID=A0A0G4IX10_PLABS|nr:hypothetical protein PBRA_007367 [Plasmodiophora brassicae]